jgi:hypothetical protein
MLCAVHCYFPHPSTRKLDSVGIAGMGCGAAPRWRAMRLPGLTGPLTAQITARVWWMRSKNPLGVILADEYWTTMTDVRLLKEDTITLVSSYGADRAEHSVLVVTDATKHGLAKVSLLQRYERSQ